LERSKSTRDNERRVFDALATLPDGAVRELQRGERAVATRARAATFEKTH
jgi:hypothetical protein